MPAIGGTTRRIVPRVILEEKRIAKLSAIQWSQDGRQLAYIVPADSGNWFVEIMTLHTGGTRRVSLPGDQYGRHFLSWSYDGKTLSYVDATNIYPSTQAATIRLLRINDQSSWRATGWPYYDFYPSWSSDNRSLYFISNRGGAMDLWQMALNEEGRPEGDAVPVTTGLGLRSAVFSPGGTKLAYSKGRKIANLWRVPIPDLKKPPATWAQAEQLTFEHAYIEAVEISLDGKRLFFDSDRAGNQDLWSMTVSGDGLQQLTRDLAPDFGPMLSPDGRELAFYSYRSGNRDIWTMPAGGGPAYQVTNHEAEDLYPRWSPNGQQIAFSSERDGGSGNIWVIPKNGGEAKRVTFELGYHFLPLYWPDGKRLAFIAYNADDESYQLWRVQLADRKLESLIQRGEGLNRGSLRWSPNGNHIYFTKVIENTGSIWSLSIEDDSMRQLTDLSGRNGQMGQYALATDDKYFYFTWEEEIGDIWVMDVEQED